jgi:hypothetical protein
MVLRQRAHPLQSQDVLKKKLLLEKRVKPGKIFVVRKMLHAGLVMEPKMGNVTNFLLNFQMRTELDVQATGYNVRASLFVCKKKKVESTMDWDIADPHGPMPQDPIHFVMQIRLSAKEIITAILEVEKELALLNLPVQEIIVLLTN